MRKILVISGMTGIGKSDIAFKMGQKYGKEVIIGDSVQLYKNFPIGGNLPKLSNVKYHLLGQFDATKERIQAPQYKKLVLKKFEEVQNIIIEGGSCFYLNYLLHSSPEIFTENQMKEAEMKVKELMKKTPNHEEQFKLLQELCPSFNNQINQHDSYRIEKALKFAILTEGKSFSGDLFNNENQKDIIQNNYDVRGVFLYSRTPYIKSILDRRCDEMILNGYLKEFLDFYKGFKQANFNYDNKSLIFPIGYDVAQQFINFLIIFQKEQATTHSKKREKMLKQRFKQFVTQFQDKTRQYSTYQRKYFRNNFEKFYWINVEKERKILEQVDQIYNLSKDDYDKLIRSPENQRKKKQKENMQLNKQLLSEPLNGCIDQAMQLIYQDIMPRIKDLEILPPLKSEPS